ncbi:MAG: helix-turn-helix transcriptional regulator, partial [Firmicutes bacterium]|nr:helix-turn-helix transcriptional regulator [Bacillota bacterium]
PGAVIRAKREETGLTQAVLARRIGVSESTLRMYELGLKAVPHDVCNQAAVALRSPEVCLAKCSECPTNWLSICLLDTDQHPSTEILRVLEEAEEAIEAVEVLAEKPLGRVQREVVERACDQVLDLVPLAAATVASWCRAYGLNMRDIHERHLKKLINRGYVRKESDAARETVARARTPSVHSRMQNCRGSSNCGVGQRPGRTCGA